MLTFFISHELTLRLCSAVGNKQRDDGRQCRQQSDVYVQVSLIC